MRAYRVFFSAAALALALCGHALAIPAAARAQAELSGTYVRYFAVGADGRFMSGLRSFQYTESGSTPYSCDFFSPGSPYEGFYVAATAGGTTTERSNTESGVAITTTTATALSGRTITWRGRWTGTGAGAQMDVAQSVTYETGDRAVRVDVTLTNSGTVALSDVYYGRRGEPDQGSCSIGGDYTTINDVVRQPPADASGLVTAETTAGVTPTVVLGMGSFDARVRGDVGAWPGSVAMVWGMPRDPGRTPEDTWVQIAFREPTLAIGASTTFTFYYVFGSSQAQVITRFDELGFPTAPCVGLAEGATCTTTAGATGLCRSGVCCTGCWNGTRCVGGTSVAACGAGGAACRSCDDGMFCTLDACTAGACSSAPSPTICSDGMSCTADVCDEATDTCMFPPTAGCTIGGECVGEGTMHPANPCQVCDPARRTDDWSPVAAGTSCGASSCTMGRLTTRACNATGMCVTSAPATCPTGACADATSCVAACDATSCAAGEYCDAATMRCATLRGPGEACGADATSCASGACVDGVCCDGACDGVCERCDVAGSEGTCAPVEAGADPDDECELACDGAGACMVPAMPDAGMVAADAGSSGDAGSMGADGGGSGEDAGARTRGGSSGGCGCRVGAEAPGARAGWVGLVLALAVALRRRRRRE